nr:hypothetical protein BaRGS_016775 [Batillaria attramentaria]
MDFRNAGNRATVPELALHCDALQNSVNARLDTQQKDVDVRVTAMENQQNIIHEDNKHILVYRLTAGSGTPAYRSYLTDWNCGCSTTDTSQSCDRYYRSRFLDLWPSDLIDTMRNYYCYYYYYYYYYCYYYYYDYYYYYY